MRKESFYHAVLLQWIPQDSDGLLLGRCGSSRACLSGASKALRSSGQWLVAQYPDLISELDGLGFLYCKLFLRHGGLDAKIAISALQMRDSRWPQDLSMCPLDIIADTEGHRLIYLMAENFPCKPWAQSLSCSAAWNNRRPSW